MAFRYLEVGIDKPVNSDELNTVLNSIIEYYNQITDEQKIQIP